MAAQRRRRRCGSGMGSRVLTTRNAHELSYAASVAGSTGSTMDGSSFSGLLTRVEIGHMRIGSAGKGRIKHAGPAPLPASGRSRPVRG
jgi:hypothetical protein